MDEPLEIGKTYQVRHSRKGTFVARITGVRGEWADAVIVSGTERAMLPENIGISGDDTTFRISLCTFTQLGEPRHG